MMHNGFAPLWWTFLAMKFVIPFVTFAIAPNRHNPPVIVFVACSIFLGTWLERYTWIAGSTEPEFYHIPMTAVTDIGITLFVIAAAVFLVRRALTKNGIVKAEV